MGEISVRCHLSGLWIDKGTPAMGVFLARHHPDLWNDGEPNLGEWLPRSLPLTGTYDGDGSLLLAPSAICQVTAESFTIDLRPATRRELQRYADGSAPWETQPAHAQVRQLLSRAVRTSDLRIENEPDLFPYERALEKRAYGDSHDDRHSVAVLMRDLAARRRREHRAKAGFRPELELGAAFLRRDVWNLLVERAGEINRLQPVTTVDGLFDLNGSWCWKQLTSHPKAYGLNGSPEYERFLREYIVVQKHLSRQRLSWAPTVKALPGFAPAYQEKAALMARYAELATRDAQRHRPHPEELDE